MFETKLTGIDMKQSTDPYRVRDEVLSLVSEETKRTMQVLAKSIATAERALESYRADQSAHFSGDADNVLKEAQEAARLIVAMNWTKAILFSRSIVQSLNDGNLLLSFHALRGYVELVAALRYTVKRATPIVQEAAATGQITAEQARQLANHLNLLLHGGRFNWATYFEQGAKGVIDRRQVKRSKEERQKFEFNNLRIAKCVDDWAKETPAAEFIYDYLCELVHPNKGSNLILLSEIDGKATFDAKGNGSLALVILNGIFPAAVSMCLRTMGDMQAVMMLLGAEDKPDGANGAGHTRA